MLSTKILPSKRHQGLYRLNIMASKRRDYCTKFAKHNLMFFQNNFLLSTMFVKMTCECSCSQFMLLSWSCTHPVYLRLEFVPWNCTPSVQVAIFMWKMVSLQKCLPQGSHLLTIARALSWQIFIILCCILVTLQTSIYTYLLSGYCSVKHPW